MERVVITGAGAVTPSSFSAEGAWQAVVNREVPFRTVDFPSDHTYWSSVGGFVPEMNAEDYIDPRFARYFDRSMAYAARAADEALVSSGILEGLTDSNIPIYLGMSTPGIERVCMEYDALRTHGPKGVSAYMVSGTISDTATGYISLKYKLHGPNQVFVAACASSTVAIGEAFHIVRDGRYRAAVVGGSDTLSEIYFAGFSAARALSPESNPKLACRPFDKNRNGFVMSEGAVVMVIETLSSAKERGANIIAEIVGFGSYSDAHHLTAPEPSGSGGFTAMSMALKDGDIPLSQVGYVNAHGTSTPTGDKVESVAIAQLFANQDYKPYVSSTKGTTGHLMGTAGAAETLFCAYSLRDSIIPGTVTTEEVGSDIAVPILLENKHESYKVAITNSFGFGGHSASLVLRAYDGS